MKVSYATGPTDQLQRIKDIGLPVHANPQGTANEHTLLAACRATLRLHAVAKGFFEGHTHLAEINGRDVTARHVSHFNSKLRGLGWMGEVKLDNVWHKPTAKQEAHCISSVAGSQASYVILVDHYRKTETPGLFLANVRKRCPNVRSGYWITMRMLGHAGVGPAYAWIALPNGERRVAIGTTPPLIS